MEPLRSTDYIPSGRTAFFDAVHEGIDLANEIKEKDERVVCIIITDGEDTASKTNVSVKAVKKLVKKYDTKADWSFTYIGKPPEYWSRKKPVSKVTYECHAPKLRSASATNLSRRLRDYHAVKRQMVANWRLLQSLWFKRGKQQYRAQQHLSELSRCCEAHQNCAQCEQLRIVNHPLFINLVITITSLYRNTTQPHFTSQPKHKFIYFNKKHSKITCVDFIYQA